MGSPSSLTDEQLEELMKASELVFESTQVQELPRESGVGSGLGAVIPRDGVAIWRLEP